MSVVADITASRLRVDAGGSPGSGSLRIGRAGDNGAAYGGASIGQVEGFDEVWVGGGSLR